MKVSGNARSVFSGRVVGLGMGRQAWVGSGLVALLCMQAMGAGPEGERVVAGSATFTRSGNTTLIQAANNTIINFRSFDIGAGQTVRFQQPSATSRVLNRVPNSVNPTRIDGSLLSNGIVYIANNAGVFFGNRAIVNVGGLYAAAGQITNQDFLNNVNHFTNVTGTVANAGTLEGRMVALVGKHITNSGAVLADGGIVTMAAGDDVLIGEVRGHMMVRIDGLAARARDGVGVENTGTVSAPGGQAMLTAGDMYSLAVNVPGRVRARDITVEGQGGGVVAVSGSLDASARGAGEVGGTVRVLGEHVGLFGATVDASGTAGGGTVLIGGNYQGSGEERHAVKTAVDRASTINADAVQSGDGGQVVVWSDGATRMSGTITARGGAESGDGGSVEVSSKGVLGFDGKVDTSAANGQIGDLLLDPTNIRVVASGGDTADPTMVDMFSDGDLGAGETSIDVVALDTASSDITLQATNDITFETAVNIAAAGVGIHARAGDDIVVNPGATITTNGGEVVFTANDSGGTQTGDGGIVINAAIDTSGSPGGFVTLDVEGGTGKVQLGANIKTDGSDVVITDPVVLTASVLIDTEQGDNSDAGFITLGNVSASGAGFDLHLDSSTGGGTAGTVTLGTVDNGGSAFLNDLTIDANGSVADGTVNLGGNISLDASGGEAADLTVNGGGPIVLTASVAIDTEQGNDADAGAVNFGTSATSAGAAGLTLAIDTVSTGGADGLVTLGDFGSGGGSTVAGLTVNAGSLAPLTNLVLSGATSITAATGDITFDSINVGSNSLSLAATAGSINEAGAGDAGVDLTAGALTLSAHDEIGGAAELDIETTVTSITASSTNNGDVVLTETDGVTLTAVSTTAGSINITTGGAVTATNVAATGGNVSITATAGDITAATVSAAGAGSVTLAATTGAILDDGVNGTLISATDATLTAGTAIGAAGATGQIDTAVSTLTANAAAGSVFVGEANGLTVTNVTAAGAGNDVTVTSTTGNITVGTVTAPDQVSVTATAGSILDDLNDSTAIGATGLTLSATTGIGTSAASGDIDTTVGTLTASASAGSVFVRESNGLTLTSVVAAGAGNDVAVTSTTGDITVATVTAPDQVSLTATAGSILDDNVNGTVISAAGATLNAGTAIGGAAGNAQVDTTIVTLNAAAANGGVFIGETNGLTLSSVTAAGAGNDISITSTTGNITVGAVSAPDNVAITANGGAILDDLNNATVIAATSANLLGSAVGAAGATGQIDTTIGSLNVSALAGSIFVGETDGLTVALAATFGPLSDFNLTSTTGDITVTTVNVVNAANITATAGSILDDGVNATTIAAATANLTAGTAIGAAGATGQIDTNIGSLTASAGAGGVFIGEANGLTLTSVAAAGAGNDVNVTSTTGDITVATVTAPNNAVLTATAGSILDDGVNGTVISATGATLTAGTAIGATGANAQLDTTLTTLTASAGNGSAFINETNGLTLTSVTAAGAGNDLNITSTTGNITVGALSAPDQVNLTASAGSILDDANDSTVINAAGASLLGAAIGAAGATNQIDTTVSTLQVSALAGSIFVGETNGLTLTSGTTFGPLSDLNLTSATGDITVGIVNVINAANITATAGSILDDGVNGTTLAAATANLTAGTAIGATGATGQIDTNIGSLTATAGNGGVFIGESNGLALTSVSALGASHDVVISSTAGDITVGAVSATNNVTLTASAGSILDDDNDSTVISANLATLTASANIGLSGALSDIDTTVTSLDVSSTTAGAVHITETDAVTLTDVDTVSGGITIASGGPMTATDVAAGGSGAVSLTADTGDLTVGAVTAAGGSIGLTATAGAIVDNATDSASDITTTGSVTLNASTGIGTGAPGSLDVDAGTIASATTATGGINLNLLDADAGGVTVTSASVTTSGDLTLDSSGPAGTLTVNGLTTAAGDISINANDLDIGGAVSAGAGANDVTITVADGDGIGLGAATVTGGMNLAGAELANITAHDLTIANTAGSGAIQVDGLAASATAGVSGTVNLLATADDGSITFSGGASSFGALNASADDGITVNASVAATTGDLALEGDADNAADTADRIAIGSGVTISALGDLTLDATTGGITGTGTYTLSAGGALTLNDALTGGGFNISAADGVTINQNLSGTGPSGIDADSNDDGNGTLTVASGATVSTAGSTLGIVAADLDLPGNLDSGAGGMTISVSNGATIRLGGASGAGMSISAAELSHITAATLALGDGGGADGSILVEGIGATDSQNVGALTLNASAPTSTVTFQNAPSTFNQVTVNAAAGVILNSGLTTDTGGLTLNADSDADGAGDITGAAPLATSGGDISLTAADYAASGTINAGSGDVTIARSAPGTIGLGDATGDMSISKLELGAITADELIIGGSNATAITVDNVTLGDVANIVTRVQLDALADDATITFQNTASSFGSLRAQADNGIVVNVGLEAMSGDLELVGDADAVADGADSIVIAPGTTISATGALALSATGGVLATAPLTLVADSDGIGAGALFIAGGTTVNTGGNSLTITAADLVLDGNINTGAGSVTIGLSNPGFIRVGDATGPGMAIDGTEFSHITATGLTIGGSNTSLVQVGSITAAQSAGISGITTFDAAANGGQVQFVNSASTFNALTVTADDGVSIAADVTSLVGGISINADSDAAPDATDRITIGGNVDITSAGALSLIGTGGITLTGATGTTNTFTGAGDANVLLADMSAATPDDDINVTVSSQGGLTVGGIGINAGSLSLTADSNSNGVASLVTSLTLLAGDIVLGAGTDANDTIDINGHVTASNSLTIQNALTVDIAGTKNLTAGNGALSVSSGIGGILLSGANDELSTISNGTGLISLAPISATNNARLTVTSGSAIQLTTVGLNGGALILGAPTISSPGGDIVLTATNVTVGGAVSTAGDDITINAATTVNAPTTSFTTGGGDLVFNGTLDANTAGSNAVTIDTGAGNANFTAAVGNFARLGALNITAAHDVNFGSLAATSLAQAAGTGTTTFNGLIDLSGLAGLSLTGNNFTFLLPTVTAGGGGATLNNSGSLTIAPGADFVLDGAFAQVGAGAVSLGAGITTTGDTVAFSAPVTVPGTIAIDTGAGAGDITFSNSLVTVAGLSLSSSGAGNVRLLGAVTLGGGLNATTSSGVIQFASTVEGSSTGVGSINAAAGAGDVMFDTDVGMGTALNSVSASGDDITVHAVRTSGGGITLAANPGATDVNASPSITDNRPSGFLTLLGNLQTLGSGAISLNAAGRTIIPSTASVFNQLGTGSTPVNLTIDSAGDVTFGQNEKFTVFGNLLINSGGVVTLSDIAALGGITINATQIRLLARPGAPLVSRVAGSTSLAPDSRMNIVAAGDIILNAPSVITLNESANAPKPVFGNDAGSRGTGAGAIPPEFSVVKLTNAVTASRMLLSDGTVLTLNTEGRSDQAVTEALAGAAPRETQSGTVTEDTTVGAAAQKELQQLEINPRSLTAGELLDFLAGRALYDDVPSKRRPDNRDFQIAVNRLPPDQVERVLAAYRDAFTREVVDADGNPVVDETGLARRADNREQVKQTLADSLRRFRGEGTEGVVDPAQFRAYVEDTPEESGAFAMIQRLDTFIRFLELLGLSPREESNVKQALLNGIRPRSIKTAALLEAIIKGGEEPPPGF